MSEKSEDSKKKPKADCFDKVVIGTTEICRIIGNVAPVTMLQMHYHEGLPIVNRDSIWWSEETILKAWLADRNATLLDERIARVEEALARWTKAERSARMP